MVQLLVDTLLYYFPDTTAVEPPGAYLCYWRPSLVHPLWIYKIFNEAFFPNWTLSTQTARFGLRPLNDTALNPMTQDGQFYLQDGVLYNLRLPLVYADKDYVNDPFTLISSNDGNTYYGYALGFGTGTAIINAQITLAGPLVLNDSITLQVLNATGNVASTKLFTANTFNYDFGNIDVSSLTITDPFLGKCAGRASPIGFRLIYDSVAGNSNISLVNLIIRASGSTPVGKQIGFVPTDFPDQAQFLGKITSYRPVSSSVWCKYEGSDLQNGGAHTCVMYGGGEHPADAGLFDFKSISETPGSYEDKVKMGSYQYWVPYSTADSDMRAPVNANEWTHPYMAITGLMSTPSQVNALRLRCYMNMEFVSRAQFWQYSAVRPNPALIQQAVAFLAGAPTSMSNDSHLERIYNWMKQAGRDVAEWAVANKDWLIPAGTAIGTALLA